MSTLDPILDENFREYVDIQLRRHSLILEGRTESAELQSLEDRMDALWEGLDENQRRSVRGMSSDLNWILRKGEPPAKGRPASEVTQEEQEELLTAQGLHEWHAVLHYLRICAATIPPARLAYFRGMAYWNIELPKYSTCFYKLAADLGGEQRSTVGVVASHRG